jgi:hypothetical protein
MVLLVSYLSFSVVRIAIPVSLGPHLSLASSLSLSLLHPSPCHLLNCCPLIGSLVRSSTSVAFVAVWYCVWFGLTWYTALIPRIWSHIDPHVTVYVLAAASPTHACVPAHPFALARTCCPFWREGVCQSCFKSTLLVHGCAQLCGGDDARCSSQCASLVQICLTKHKFETICVVLIWSCICVFICVLWCQNDVLALVQWDAAQYKSSSVHEVLVSW